MSTTRRELLRSAAYLTAGSLLAAPPAGAQAPTSSSSSSPTTPPADRPSAAADAALFVELLRLEHSAVHGYGRLGPLLTEPLRDLARLHADVHRLQRDALRRAILERRQEAPPPEVAYALPSPARDATTARVAAETIERRTLAGYHAALPDLEDPEARGLCAQLLAQAAVNLAELARRRNPPPVLPPFPGRPT